MNPSLADMSQLTRNDSSSVISSLQMDYGDSDEDEPISKDTSRNDESTDKVEMPSWLEQKINPAPEPEIPASAGSVKTDDGNPSQESKESIPKEEENPASTANISTDPPEREMEVSPVDFISDDEEGDGRNHHHHHHRHKHLVKAEEERRKAVAEALNTDSPSSQGSTGAPRKATRLVSYGPDEVDDEESQSEEEPEQVESAGNSADEEATDPTALSRSVQNMSSEDIKIPPEPPGKCSIELQDKIRDMFDRKNQGGLDLNVVIQSKKNFRNPSIYEKLIDFCHIDEKGTNFPPEIYDPHIWGKESFYDELDKMQRKDMERREKEKKERTKIEFMTGTKKSSSASSGDHSGPSDEKKRKTKWDAQPSGTQAPLLKAPGVQGPGVVNLTATATGTKATIISAVGSLSKKK